MAKKVEFFDENRNNVPLPDSTCLIVVEKQEKNNKTGKHIKADIQILEANYVNRLSKNNK